MSWWPEPAAGDIVWCHFPDGISPRPKPKPALVLTVFDDEAPAFYVEVAYGTSQRTSSLRSGEFVIQRLTNRAAYIAAGLSYDTKFDLKNSVKLPFNGDWFDVPPAAPHGQCPQLGLLHPSLMQAVQAAYRAAKQP